MKVVAKSRPRTQKLVKKTEACNCRNAQSCKRAEKEQNRCNARQCPAYKKPKK